MLSFDRFRLSNRHPNLPSVCWPIRDASTGTMKTWRGGGFNEAWRSHFVRGMRHRVPGYVSTTANRSAAQRFMEAGLRREEAAVEWCFELPEDSGHILYLNADQEFTLRPYTVVQVVDVQWQALSDWPHTLQKTSCENPHRIVVRVEPEGTAETIDIPVAPWH